MSFYFLIVIQIILIYQIKQVSIAKNKAIESDETFPDNVFNFLVFSAFTMFPFIIFATYEDDIRLACLLSSTLGMAWAMFNLYLLQSEKGSRAS